MATPHEFIIPVSTLDAGGKAFHFPLRTAWLRAALEESGVGVGDSETADAGALDLRASRSGNDIVLHGRLVATLVTECARCTGPAHVQIDQPLTTLAVPASSIARPPPPKPKPKAEEVVATPASAAHTGATPITPRPDARNDRARLTAGAHGPGGAALREKAAKEGVALIEKAARNGRARSGENDLAEYEFTAEEADTLAYEGDTVVLDDFVRDELLLEIPMIPLCSEDCAGIQPGPSSREPDPSDLAPGAGGGEDARGVDIDPRLAPLLKLKLGKP